MPNFVRHAPSTFEQLGSTIGNCPSIDEAARRAFNNKRYTDSVAFLRETNGRTVVAFIRVQDAYGTMTIRKLESFTLGRKKGGRVPLDTVPELFLRSSREIFKYFATAEAVVDSVVGSIGSRKMTDRPKKRVVRTDSSKKVIDAFGEMTSRLDDLSKSGCDGSCKPVGSHVRLPMRPSGRLVKY